MTLPAASRLQFTPDLAICRILNGMWQVSGAHGRIDRDRAVEAMFRYHEAGFTTWDLADHYGPAEDLVGEFRRKFAARYGRGAARRDSGLYQMGAIPWPDDPRHCRAGGRHLIAADGGELPRSAAIPLVGLRRPALSRCPETPRRSARGGQNPPSGLDQFRHRASADHHRARHPDRLEPGAVFAGRPPAGD